jgi:hypothetical protein
MEPYVTLTIVVSLTLILLAFMAMFIEIGVEWLEGSKFPKINITFKKDTSLFDFLRSSKSKGGNKKEIKTAKEEKTVVEAKEEVWRKGRDGLYTRDYNQSPEGGG